MYNVLVKTLIWPQKSFGGKILKNPSKFGRQILNCVTFSLKLYAPPPLCNSKPYYGVVFYVGLNY